MSSTDCKEVEVDLPNNPIIVVTMIRLLVTTVSQETLLFQSDKIYMVLTVDVDEPRSFDLDTA